MAVANAASQRKRRGRVGGECYRESNGVTVVSELSLGPTNAPTAIQQGNRAAFRMLVVIGRKIKTSIDYGFNEQKGPTKPGRGNQAAWGAFMGQNRQYSQQVFTYTNPAVPVFQPMNLLTAKGSITTTPVSTATGSVGSNNAVITWPATADGSGQNLLDETVLVFFNQTQDKWFSIQAPNGFLRSAGTATVSFGTNFSFALTDVVRVWLSFRGYEAGPISSIYTGKESDSVNMTLTISA